MRARWLCGCFLSPGTVRGMEEADLNSITANARFQVDGVTFVCGYHIDPTPGTFTLVKSPSMVERYRALVADLEHPRIVEIGIAHGGSVALLTLLTQPSKLVAIELDREPVGSLSSFIDERSLGDSVVPYYGVDQSDEEQILDIVEREFGGGPLDLVIDDASHLYGPTVTSFECLFPLLRPGGKYLIEDWKWLHIVARVVLDAIRDPSSEDHAEMMGKASAAEGQEQEIPLSRLAAELVLLCANDNGMVERVSVDQDWIAVRRGEDALDPHAFRLADVLTDHFGTLSSRALPSSPRQDGNRWRRAGG